MAQFYVRGKLEAKKSGTNKDGRAYTSLQFLVSDGWGGLTIRAVFLPDGYDHAKFVEGREIEIPIRVSAKDSRLFLRLDDTVEVSKHLRAVP